MHKKRKALLAAGLIAGAAALTGCTAVTAPSAASTPQAAQQETAEPETAQPAQQAAEEAEPDSAGETPLPLSVDGEETDAQAIEEDGDLLLPLEATAQALGWKTDSQETEEETQVKRVVTLEKDESRITVSWTVSDNTTKNIAWQKDGLLIPVNTRITTVEGTVYVPSAFFEEAMKVRVSKAEEGVSVRSAEPADTPLMREESAGENG